MCVNVCEYVRLCLIVCDYVSVCACVQDLVDMNFLKQGAPGYSNCEVLPGDRILKVRKESRMFTLYTAYSCQGIACPSNGDFYAFAFRCAHF